MAQNPPAIVFDNGSGFIKAGFANEVAPRVVDNSVVGIPRKKNNNNDNNNNNNDDNKADKPRFGSEALSSHSSLSLKYPNEYGIVTNWDQMSLIWEDVFANQLRVDAKEHAVFMTEPPINPKANREKTMQVLFETIHAPAAYLAVEQMLSLMSTGRTSGLVVDLGYGASQIVPIFNSALVPAGVTRLRIAGREISDYLQQLLSQRNINLDPISNKHVLDSIKEKLCYINESTDEKKEAEQNQQNQQNQPQQSFELPDGEVINIGDECYRAPEILFRPSLIGSEIGITEQIVNSILKCELNVRKEMCFGITLSGGSSLFRGLSTRLAKEVQAKFPVSNKVKVDAGDGRKYASWVGGSIIAALPSFKSRWVTKEEYAEYGAAVVHRKCAI